MATTKRQAEPTCTLKPGDRVNTPLGPGMVVKVARKVHVNIVDPEGNKKYRTFKVKTFDKGEVEPIEPPTDPIERLKFCFDATELERTWRLGRW